MTSAEKKISAFCARHGLAYEWQPLRCNGSRAVIESIDRQLHAATLRAACRLKGVHVDDWTSCGSGSGVWEGRIFLQDESEWKRINAVLTAESKRNENWNQVYHDCIVGGMSHADASRCAEDLYPTPANLG